MASEMEERGCGIRPCSDTSIVCTYGKLFYGSLIEKAFLQNSNFRGFYIIFYFLSMFQIYGMVSIGMNVYLLANTTSKPTQ